MSVEATDIEEALVVLLTGGAGISTDTMNGVATIGAEVFHEEAEQGAVDPKLCWTLISAIPDYVMDGFSGQTTSRFRLGCYGTTASAGKLAHAIEANMTGFAGVVGSVWVQSCFVDDRQDILDPDPGISANAEAGVQFDFLITWTLDLGSL